MTNINCLINAYRNVILIVIILSLSSLLTAQTTSDGLTPQFLFTDFSISKIVMKNSKSQTIMLNYNTVSEKMVYEKEGKLYDLVNLEMVDTVITHNRKFVPSGNVFHEVLLVAPISLFVQYKGELLPPGTPAGYGGTSQVSNTKLATSVQLSSGYYNLKLPTDYIVKVDPVYWLRKENTRSSFINERQFLKIFPEKELEFKKFIKKNKIKFFRPADLVRLIEYCNELMR